MGDNPHNKPWFWPVPTDAAWCAKQRKEYNLSEYICDDDIRNRYADGCRYAVLWDHVGDAYEEFEALADYILGNGVVANVIEPVRTEAEKDAAIADLERRLKEMLAKSPFLPPMSGLNGE